MIRREVALRGRWIAVPDSSGRNRLEFRWVVEQERSADQRDEAQLTAA
jgi:hypothetical protein